MSEKLNEENLEKERKRTEKDMVKRGAKRIRDRNEKGRFTGDYRLEATKEQIEKAKKEMEDNLEKNDESLEREKEEIDKMLNYLENRTEKLLQRLKELKKESDPEGVNLRSDKDIEEEAMKVEDEIKKIEKERGSSKARLKNEKKRLSMKDIERMTAKKNSIKSQEDISNEFLKYMNEDLDESSSSEDEDISSEMKQQKERVKEYEAEVNKIINQEEEEETHKDFVDNIAEKILNNEVLDQEELEFQSKNQNEIIQKVAQLQKEREGSEKERAEVEKERSSKDNDKDVEGENVETEDSKPENLAEFLEKDTLGEKNKSILKGKWWRRARHLAAGIGGAKLLRSTIEKIPGLSIPASAVAGGVVTGVGLKLGHYGLEKWQETKNYSRFTEGLESEIKDLSDEETVDSIEFKMAKLNTNASILNERIKELEREKEEIKNSEGFFWFLKEEGRDINNTIKEHQKVLEKTEDQFRYLSVELKDKEENLDVEELAEELINIKADQLREKIEKGGPHADLFKIILKDMEGTEKIPGLRDEQKEEVVNSIEESKVGLMGKLKHENRSAVKEILTSAAFAGIIGGIAGFAMESEVFEDGLENIKGLFDSGAPEAEIESEINGLSTIMQEEVLEIFDEIAEKEISYAIESGDSVWSVTEEFLLDNLGEDFQALTEAEKTYVIDHITTTIESNPEKFGLELASGETIENLFADKHNLNFGPLLDGELEIALKQAESLSTEEVANILENNEKIRSFLSDHPGVRIDGATIQDILTETAEDLTEEKIAEELIIDGLRSDSLTAAEQLENIEGWLEDMKSGNLSEAHFDFMADTSSGGRRELWIEQLAKIEGVTFEEMEVVVESSYDQLTSEATIPSASEEAAEIASEKSSWLESVEETFQDLKVEGEVSSMDKWNLFESFTAEFGEEILVDSDVIDLLEQGEITPQEFIDWMEDGAFDRSLDFGGDLHPKEFYVNQLKATLEILENAENQNLYRGARRMIKTQIERFILLGKQ